MIDLNPQAKQMADESMVRTLAAQTRAIWPQERPLVQRYALPAAPSILDAGCGTGEATIRLAELFPQARILGVDIIDEHLARASARASAFASRVTFAHQSLYELEAAGASFDLTVCRHVLHSIPETARALRELVRVTRPGGYLHLIPEDYGMMHFEPGKLDLDEFWYVGPPGVGRATGTDPHVGRSVFGHLRRLGLTEIAIDYVVVDTIRVERETFADIIAAWRDGYVDAIAEATPFSKEHVEEAFAQMLATIEDPTAYAVWFVPIVSARVPKA